MEIEKFLSGYCRVLDGARTVAAVVEDGVLTECDCCFPDCVYAGSCKVAEQLKELES